MRMKDQGNTMLWGRGFEAAWSDSLRLWTVGRWWAGAGAAWSNSFGLWIEQAPQLARAFVLELVRARVKFISVNRIPPDSRR